MEQRRLRLGDIVDDYCPRERLVTNHAIAVIVDNQITRTRCSACETEHAYKAAKVPRRKAGETAQLYRAVLAERDGAASPALASEPVAVEAAPAEAVPAHATPAPAAAPNGGTVAAPEDGPVRRPLIRAQLPRPEGLPKERPIPEFTVRQPGSRSGGFYGDPRGRGGRDAQGGSRGGHGRPGGGQGGRHGHGGPGRHGDARHGRPQPGGGRHRHPQAPKKRGR